MFMVMSEAMVITRTALLDEIRTALARAR